MRKKPDNPNDQLINKTFSVRHSQIKDLSDASLVEPKVSVNELVRQGIDIVTKEKLNKNKGD